MSLSPWGDSHKARQIKALPENAQSLSPGGDKNLVAVKLSH